MQPFSRRSVIDLREWGLEDRATTIAFLCDLMRLVVKDAPQCSFDFRILTDTIAEVSFTDHEPQEHHPFSEATVSTIVSWGARELIG